MIAAMKDLNEKKFGVTEIARRLNRTSGRIRQICIAEKIGVCYGGRYRMLSENDVKRIATFLKDS